MTEIRLSYVSWIILFILLVINPSYSTEYKYEIRKKNGHVIHVITLDQSAYETQFVKAHNQVFGREHIESMALRSQGEIAINAGFFEIGQDRDGMPSGTLIIDGKIFGFKPKKHSYLIQTQNLLKIESSENPMVIKIGQQVVPITKVNQFIDKNDFLLLTDSWGPNTLTPFKNRQEISCDGNGKIIEISKHGNNPIPRDGFVLSFPDSFKIDKISLQDIITMDFGNLSADKNDRISAVMGIPQLLKDGKIAEEILNNKGSFYVLPHSRTAIGLKKDGTIVIVVVEHAYKKDLTQVTLGEVKELIQNNKIKMIFKYKKMPNNITIDDLKKIVKEEFSDQNGPVGFTIPELAQFMIELDCESALNLDGGGSSTLWVEGRVVNQTRGDADEDSGRSVVRCISDALVFKKKDST